MPFFLQLGPPPPALVFALNFLGDGLRDILDPRDTQKLEN